MAEEEGPKDDTSTDSVSDPRVRYRLGKDKKGQIVREGDYVQGYDKDEDKNYFGVAYFTGRQPRDADKKGRIVEVERSDHEDGGGGTAGRWRVRLPSVQRIAQGKVNEIPDEHDEEMVDWLHHLIESGIDELVHHFKTDHDYEATVQDRNEVVDLLKKIIPAWPPAKLAMTGMTIMAILTYSKMLMVLDEKGIDPNDLEATKAAMDDLIAGINKPEASDTSEVQARVQSSKPIGDDPASEIIRRMQQNTN